MLEPNIWNHIDEKTVRYLKQCHTKKVNFQKKKKETTPTFDTTLVKNGCSGSNSFRVERFLRLFYIKTVHFQPKKVIKKIDPDPKMSIPSRKK